MKGEKPKRVTIRIEQELLQEIEVIAARAGRTASDLLHDALRRFVVTTRRKPNCRDLAEQLGIIGASATLATDLSTQRKYFAEFGE